MANNFTWFDRPPTIDAPRHVGALSAIGKSLQGIAAPFAAAYQGQTGYAQLQLQQQQDQADLEFQKYLLSKQNNVGGKPIFTVGSDGNLMQVQLPGGINPPKGSQVIPPTSMQTPDQKTSEAVGLASKKDSAVRAQKLKELTKAVDFFENKIHDVPGGKGLGGRIQGLSIAAQGMAQTNPKISAYMSSVDGLRSQIARGLGEVGNLSEYEQKYAVNLLPKVTDNLETRQEKLNSFRDYIKTRLEPVKDTKSDFQSFTVEGKQYNIPSDKAEAFKKAKGIK